MQGVEAGKAGAHDDDVEISKGASLLCGHASEPTRGAGFRTRGPAVVIQADALNRAGSDGVILAVMTSTLRDAPLLRLDIDPKEAGLERPTQVMVEKLLTVRRSKLGRIVGHLSASDLVALNRLLAFVIGLA
ncbi:MAG: type II toxin-antitoxin system PemK/MazF family toxin [Deltaproteobacteria bacterium]|nr:type II toxin-antitoxin system PemK/MazF family toxin [Deltaproteobacteria bacterium]